MRHSSAAPGPTFSITSRPWFSSSACTPPATSGAPGGPHRGAQAGTLDALGSPLRGSWSAVIGVEAGEGWGGGGLLCFTKGASCAYGLLCAPFQVHSTCTVVIRDTDRCILGSESQRTGWDVGLAWITSGGILVRCRGSWGGGVAPQRLPWLPIEAPWPPPLHHLSMHYSPHGHQHGGIPSGCGVPRG